MTVYIPDKEKDKPEQGFFLSENKHIESVSKASRYKFLKYISLDIY